MSISSLLFTTTKSGQKPLLNICQLWILESLISSMDLCTLESNKKKIPNFPSSVEFGLWFSPLYNGSNNQKLPSSLCGNVKSIFFSILHKYIIVAIVWRKHLVPIGISLECLVLAIFPLGVASIALCLTLCNVLTKSL